MQTNRRFFLRNGALAIAGTTAIPSFLVRSVMAEAQAVTAPGRQLVVIFQRGAADGLNVVVPYREKNYYAMRPGIAIPDNQVIDLDGFFGLHPALAPFKPLYDQGHLAIIHAAGSPTTSGRGIPSSQAQKWRRSAASPVGSCASGLARLPIRIEFARINSQNPRTRKKIIRKSLWSPPSPQTRTIGLAPMITAAVTGLRPSRSAQR